MTLRERIESEMNRKRILSWFRRAVAIVAFCALAAQAAASADLQDRNRGGKSILSGSAWTFDEPIANGCSRQRINSSSLSGFAAHSDNRTNQSNNQTCKASCLR